MPPPDIASTVCYRLETTLSGQPVNTESSAVGNHVAHVLIQVAKILNGPGVRRQLYAVLPQGSRNQVPVRAKYYRRNDDAWIIMEPLFERGSREVGRGGIAFPGQWPGALDICAMAHRASLYEEIFPVDVLREGE